MEVDLDGHEGLVLAGSGLELDVDLRAVERRFTFGLVELQADLLEDAAEQGFPLLPHGRVVDVLFAVPGVAEGEPVGVVL